MLVLGAFSPDQQIFVSSRGSRMAFTPSVSLQILQVSQDKQHSQRSANSLKARSGRECRLQLQRVLPVENTAPQDWLGIR